MSQTLHLSKRVRRGYIIYDFDLKNEDGSTQIATWAEDCFTGAGMELMVYRERFPDAKIVDPDGCAGEIERKHLQHQDDGLLGKGRIEPPKVVE